VIIKNISPNKVSREYTGESVLLRKEATEFIIHTDTQLRSIVAGIHGPHVVKQPRKVPRAGQRASKERFSNGSGHSDASTLAMLLRAQATLLNSENLCYFPSHIPRLEGSVAVDNCRQAC